METISVGVVIPVYNRPKLALEAIDSVLSQTLPPRRLLIVDDGSTDNTLAAIRSWLDQRNSPVETLVIEQANQGPAAARNTGFAKLNDCEFVLFHDSDDLLPLDFLERTYPAISSDPAAIAVTVDRLFLNQQTGKTRYYSSKRIARNPIKWLLTHRPAIGQASLFRSSAVTKVGCYDANIPTGHDLALFLRLGLQGKWLYASGEPVQIRDGRGAAEHVSKRHADRHLVWANLMDDFFSKYGEQVPVPYFLYGHKVSRYWHLAGKSFLKDGKATEARTYFRRALHWQWWNLSSFGCLCWTSFSAQKP